MGGWAGVRVRSSFNVQPVGRWPWHSITSIRTEIQNYGLRLRLRLQYRTYGRR